MREIKTVSKWLSEWRKLGGRGDRNAVGTGERFGQYVVNRDARLEGSRYQSFVDDDTFHVESWQIAFGQLTVLFQVLPTPLHPDAPPVPEGYKTRTGVEYGCGQFHCTDCYEPLVPVKE